MTLMNNIQRDQVSCKLYKPLPFPSTTANTVSKRIATERKYHLKKAPNSGKEAHPGKRRRKQAKVGSR